MTSTYDGGAAFPRIYRIDQCETNGGNRYEQVDGESGMSLRDYFAAKAMSAMLPINITRTSGPFPRLRMWLRVRAPCLRGIIPPIRLDLHHDERPLVEQAYRYADHMLAERAKAAP